MSAAKMRKWSMLRLLTLLLTQAYGLFRSRHDLITVSGSPDHFGLMAAQHVLRQVDELVAETRKRRNLLRQPG